MDSANSSTGSTSRNLRKKARKVYRDDGLDDDEIDGMQMFDLEEKINREMPSEKFYLEMEGSDLTLKYFQKNGFSTPILIREKSGLGLRMPSQNFTVNDVKRCVGSSRVLNVMDVSTQKDLEMTLKEWVKYYENPERHRLLNVISLEFSQTKLENYVDQPEVVHQMDWVDLVWPCHLKEFYGDPVTGQGRMLYPKVQKYCLMSVGGCYTDFHIDMGGTSVWYHILRGRKIFWLIPPTEDNLVAYENWTLSGRQGDVFFGDIVTDCYRITLEAGFTFLIPTGWIHAVYTPEDSLVFGGNFLHCFNIRLQLRVWEVEVKTRVPTKFRYPLFAEIHWYVLERYVSCLLGRAHRARGAEEQVTQNGEECSGSNRSAFEAALKDRVVEEEKSLSVAGGQDLNGLVDNRTFSGNGSNTLNDNNFLNGDSSNSSSANRQNIFDVMCGILTTDDQTQTSNKDQDASEQRDSSVCALNPTPCSESVAQCGSTAHGGAACSSVTRQDSSVGYSISHGSGGRSELSGQTDVLTARHRNMARYEVEGLQEIVHWLENLPAQKKNVPKDISDPDLLLADTKKLIEYHRGDDPDLAVTGKSIIKISAPKAEKQKRKPSVQCQQKEKVVRSTGTQRAAETAAGVWKYRRVRCKQCEPCTRSDCRECLFCRDMIKYGGPGRMKQTCASRQCLGTVLPATAVCEICQHAKCSEVTVSRGQRWTPSTPHATYDETYDGEMMECRVCFEVVHPACLRVECIEVEGRDLTHSGIVDEDVPSSWECARCCTEGKAGQGKHRAAKPSYNPRPHRRRTDESSDSSDNDEETDSLADKSATQSRRSAVNGNLPSRTRSRSIDDDDDADCSSKLMKMNSVVPEEAESIASSSESYTDNSCSPSVQQLQLLQQHQQQLLQQHHQLQLLHHQSPTAVRSWSPATGLRPPAELPTKVNSRGREISTPRRYLL